MLFCVFRIEIFNNFAIQIVSNSNNKYKRILIKLTCPNRFQATFLHSKANKS
jgi:hypothetical protein